MDETAEAEVEFSPRQREVLDAVLALMVEEGTGFSTARVARRARCSKATLYKWFGDRHGVRRARVATGTRGSVSSSAARREA